jgi:hypothetical protein
MLSTGMQSLKTKLHNIIGQFLINTEMHLSEYYTQDKYWETKIGFYKHI